MSRTFQLFTQFQLWWDSLLLFPFFQSIWVVLDVVSCSIVTNSQRAWQKFFCTQHLSCSHFLFHKRRIWVKQEPVHARSSEWYIFPKQYLSSMRVSMGKLVWVRGMLRSHCGYFSLYLLHGQRFLGMSCRTWLFKKKVP